MVDEKSRLRWLVGTAILVAILVLAAAWIHAALHKASAGPPGLVVRKLEVAKVAEVEPVPGQVIRAAVDAGRVVEVTVVDELGAFLVADVSAGGEVQRIRGSGAVNVAAPDLLVASPGFAAQRLKVDPGGSAVRVVMKRVIRVEGFVYDVATAKRLRGVAVALEDLVGNSLALPFTTADDGGFRFDCPSEGDVVIRGGKAGYLPISGGASSAHGGVVVDVERGIHVEIPLHPVYVALCELQNSTNLDDRVLRALVACRFVEQPGRELPEFHSRSIVDGIVDVSRRLGIVHAYGTACILDGPAYSLEGTVAFVVRGQGSLGTAKVTFQPWLEFLEKPLPTRHVASQRWATSTLTVESPLPLRICPSGGFVFGGVTTEPGTFSCALPEGRYVVGPLDDHGLLTGSEWTQMVDLRSAQVVKVHPKNGFGTLRIEGGGKWSAGILTCKGGGASLAIMLDRLPVEMPVTPGKFRFDVRVGAADREVVVWSRELAIEAGARRVLLVGVD